MSSAMQATAIAAAIVGPLVSTSSNTVNVIGAATTGFGNIINSAAGPVPGSGRGGYQGSNGSQLSNSPGIYLA